MTAKSGIYFHFFSKNWGYPLPPVVLRGGSGSPLAETLHGALPPIIYIEPFSVYISGIHDTENNLCSKGVCIVKPNKWFSFLRPTCLSQCWFIVGPASQTMVQHWAIVVSKSRVCRDQAIWSVADIPVNSRRWPNAGLILSQRRRPWTNTKPTLGERVVFSDTGVTGSWPVQWWA